MVSSWVENTEYNAVRHDVIGKFRQHVYSHHLRYTCTYIVYLYLSWLCPMLWTSSYLSCVSYMHCIRYCHWYCDYERTNYIWIHIYINHQRGQQCLLIITATMRTCRKSKGSSEYWGMIDLIHNSQNHKTPPPPPSIQTLW